MTKSDSLAMFHALKIVKTICGKNKDCHGCPAFGNDNICGVLAGDEDERIPSNWEVYEPYEP